ncbi:hypothetical protein, partial [Nonomuraea sp. NPDC049784]|uniref:hypothetical protein n=1 Tax=Nonomuraea sp. NPDC049784 TaxID=3154361 RepID=UPI00340E744F
IRARADQAASGGPDRLLRACEALNLAALTASDCGLPDLARAWCWHQFTLIHQARPLPLETAKLALQPVINLARLRIRDGDGHSAWQLLHDLFTAVQSQRTADLDGRNVTFDNFTPPADQRQLCAWLWEVLLADGLCALARASRWEQALAQAEQLRGIGARLWEGRQIAILARCFAGHPDDALDMLHGSELKEPWEHAVASCLSVLCLRAARRPAQEAERQMTAHYLALADTGMPELAAFTTRLGLAVTDLLDHRGDQSVVHERLVTLATSPGGSYAARDVLAHAASAKLLTEQQKGELTKVVDASGLGQGRMPVGIYNAVATSMSAAASAVRAGAAEDL